MKNVYLSLAVALLLLSACKKESSTDKMIDATATTTGITKEMINENGNNPDEIALSGGATANKSGHSHLYIESNDAAQNKILVYEQQSSGHLIWITETASGGKGAGAGLGSQGAVALDKRHDLLLAVNAGSNSVSSFRIKDNGKLELLHTVSTGGVLPISVTVYNEWVYVVNSTSSDISGFRIDGGGQLYSLPGSHLKLSADNAGPAEISFTPHGEALVVTEKNTNKITAFDIRSNGVAYNRVVTSSVGTTPFGFDFAGDYMIVTNADGGNAGTSSCTSYRNADRLRPVAVSGKVGNGQSAVCWAAATAFGRFTFVANTGSNTLSSYYVDPSGHLYLLPWVNVPTGGKPADIIVSSDNEFVYNISGGDNKLGEYKRDFFGDLQNIGTINSLPDFAAGLVSR